MRRQFIGAIWVGILPRNGGSCLVREQCNQSEICTNNLFEVRFDLDTNENVGFHVDGHGQCVNCSDLSSWNCSDPCYTWQGMCLPDTFGMLAGFDKLLPFYILGVAGVIKPLVQNVILTARKDATQTKRKYFLQFCMLGMACNSLISDATKALRIFERATSDSLWNLWNLWQAYLTIVASLSASSNMISGMAMTGMLFGCSIPASRWKAKRQNIIFLFSFAIGLTYAFCNFWFVVLSLPTMAAYFWISCPLCAMTWVFSKFLSLKLASLIEFLNGTEQLDDAMVQAISNDKQRAKEMDIKGWWQIFLDGFNIRRVIEHVTERFFTSINVATCGLSGIRTEASLPDGMDSDGSDDSGTSYLHGGPIVGLWRYERRLSHESKMKVKRALLDPLEDRSGETLSRLYYAKLHASLHMSFFLPMISAGISLFQTVNCRFLSGFGYWLSLSLSLNERHAASYFNNIRFTGGHVVDLIWTCF